MLHSIQWLPYKIQFQWVYLLYRWLASFLFIAVIIDNGVVTSSLHWFTFATNWSVFMLNVYLLWAALATTYKMLREHACGNKPIEIAKQYHDFDDTPMVSVCCVGTKDWPSWYQKIQWALFYVAVSSALTVSFLYWVFVYDSTSSSINFANIGVHALNAVLMFFDIFFSGTPMRILHFYFSLIFGVIFISFTGIYFAICGNIVYGVLDYAMQPGPSAGYAIGLAAAFSIGHLLSYLVYLLRLVLSSLCCFRMCVRVPSNGIMELETA